MLIRKILAATALVALAGLCLAFPVTAGPPTVDCLQLSQPAAGMTLAPPLDAMVLTVPSDAFLDVELAAATDADNCTTEVSLAAVDKCEPTAGPMPLPLDMRWHDPGWLG